MLVLVAHLAGTRNFPLSESVRNFWGLGDCHTIAVVVYDRRMLVFVDVQTVHPRKLVAVRREVEAGSVGAVWGRAGH